MIGISGAVSARPSVAPATSIARFASRTLRNTESQYHDGHLANATGARFCAAYITPRSPSEPTDFHNIIRLAILDPMVATIRLSVPGTLRYRPIAVRTVAEAARLVSGAPPRDPKSPTFDPLAHDVRHPFDTAVVSAFMEIFNNIAIHAYQRKGGGLIEIEIAPSKDAIVIEVKDHGRPFDLDEVEPLPDLDEDALPEGGMG